MKWLILLIGLSCFFESCSIIDDSDITDPNANFKIIGISLVQTSQEGTRSLGRTTIVNDDQGRIDSIIWSDVSNNNDFRFRTGSLDPLVGLQGSGITTNGAQSGVVTTSFFYNTDGSIFAINNRLNGKLFEAYVYQYDLLGRVQIMFTFYGDGDNPCLVNKVDCAGEALLLIDSVAYKGSKIDYIRRIVNNGTFKSTSAFYMAYGNVQSSCNQPGNFADDELAAVAVREFTFITEIPPPEISTFDQCQQTTSSHQYIHSKYGEWYGGSINSNKYTGTLDYYPNIKGNLLATTSLIDERINYDGTYYQNQGLANPQNRVPDFYYFHPFLFFPSQFNHGIEMSQIYFVDWWIIPQDIDLAFTFTQNRKILIEFLVTR